MTDVLDGTQDDVADRLDHGLEALGLSLRDETRAKLLEYVSLLEKWNKTYSLTSIRGGARIVSVHLLDCLAVVPHLSGRKLLDVGSGAGLPGIPLALARPEIHVTLLDSSHKKAAFLRQVLTELHVTNASVECERVENWRPGNRFDCIVSRAYADLAEFVTSTGHALSPAGVLAAMKGVYPFEEIEKLPSRFRVIDVVRIEVPTLASQRHLVLMRPA
jgi:16S rRNA (guanine527-N7)-methyltransferase